MALTINTNIGSLNAQRNLGISQRDLATSMQRLSSGLRINSAKDDAAGLAISDRMTAQVRGLNQASRNANDGISMAQTAEGALQESTNILQRIRELAVQSANDTNTNSDRASLNSEVQQLKEELNRIASTTEFNGRKVIDGTMKDATFQVGPNAGKEESISFSVASSLTKDLSQDGVAIKAPGGRPVQGVSLSGSIPAGSLVVNGKEVGAATNNSELAAAIHTADEAVTARPINHQQFEFSKSQLEVKDDFPLTVNIDNATPVTATNFTINGVDPTKTVDTNDAKVLATAINAQTTDGKFAVEATASNVQEFSFTPITVLGTETYTLDLKTGTPLAALTPLVFKAPDTAVSQQNIVDKINTLAPKVTANIENNKVVISTQNGENLSIKDTLTAGGSSTGTGFNEAVEKPYSGELSLTSKEAFTVGSDTPAALEAMKIEAGKYPGPAIVAGKPVTGALKAGDLTINGRDIGAVEGDATKIAAAIQEVDTNIIATPENIQTIGWGDVNTSAGSYTLELDGKPIIIKTADDKIDGEEIAAAIGNTDGFTATYDNPNVVVTRAGGQNFTIKQRHDGTTAGFEASMSDGRDLRGTVQLKSNIEIDIAGQDPSKAGMIKGVNAPGVKGTYTLKLTLPDKVDPDAVITVDTKSAMASGVVTAEDVAKAINSDIKATMEFSAKVNDDGMLEITRNDGKKFKITEEIKQNGTDIDDTSAGMLGVGATAKDFVGQVELDSKIDIVLEGDSLGLAGLTGLGNSTISIDQINVLTSEASIIAMASVDEAIMDIDAIRGGLGAVQNRFTSTISNLSNVSENLSAARSRILDTDIAMETSAMTKNNILQQAGVSILTQANQTPQLALSLLKG
ncbi:flagellin N-terminal helical domain-containing protein [Desulfotalea psychrophila]|uniref:Flagellin n=1 Tax=Desulfotalea psychrophila (strain LSv54 / DSM 12343) TaxID=177439 RepID=Q6AJQ8_DESPS|nr:flagellin [Desulfotalea psychrophila]CAG37422.1 probable flagellin (FliC) [Desulfotalea psychrophila LSv54]